MIFCLEVSCDFLLKSFVLVINVRVSQYACRQRTGIAAGVEFIERPARNRCPIKK
jgi:hypothetical protein